MITPDGDITEHPTPTSPSGPFGIATGPDNTIWFTESGSAQVGHVLGLITPSPPAPPAPTPNTPGTNEAGGPSLADTGLDQAFFIALAIVLTSGSILAFRRLKAQANS